MQSIRDFETQSLHPSGSQFSQLYVRPYVEDADSSDDEGQQPGETPQYQDRKPRIGSHRNDEVVRGTRRSYRATPPHHTPSSEIPSPSHIQKGTKKLKRQPVGDTLARKEMEFVDPAPDSHIRQMLLKEEYKKQKKRLFDSEAVDDDVGLRKRNRWLTYLQWNSQLDVKLNRVEWRAFRRLRTNSRFVIDVLAGEPDFAAGPADPEATLDQAGTDSETNLCYDYCSSSPDRKYANLGPRPFCPIQGALPERIRINSWYILRFLKTEIGQGFISLDERVPLVMVRPFKALVHYRQLIRNYCVTLEEKWARASTTVVLDDPTTHPVVLKAETKALSKGLDSTEEWVPYLVHDLGRHSTIKASTRTTLSHVNCLLDFIENDINARLLYLSKNDPMKITFPDVWYLFKPGDEIITRNGGQAFRIMSTTSTGHGLPLPQYDQVAQGRKPSSISESVSMLCVRIDFDGVFIGPCRTIITIPRFDGERLVTNLHTHPIRFIPGAREQLIERGRLFPRYTTIRHMHYSGATLCSGEEVDGEVVIDFEATISNHSGWKPAVEDLWGSTAPEDFGGPRLPCSGFCCEGANVSNDAFVERLRNDSYASRPTGRRPGRRDALLPISMCRRIRSDLNSVESPINDDEYLIMSEGVLGFLLHSRKWARFDIERLTYANTLVKPEVGDDEAGDADNPDESFSQLVLPPGHKELVKSLIAQHFRDKASTHYTCDTTDIIRGKGKGLILLLHGAPGVGKTTTAECIAAYFNKPLFHITCGDLGTCAQDVEKALLKNFTLADRWGCILLLDEADVFLSSRTPTDHMRNSMVSVFLRILEYYSGVLFLTTNRVGDFDEAFASRVHMSLYYPPLSKETTLEIFSLNLERIKNRFEKRNRKFTANHMEIGAFIGDYWHRFPEGRWNGRQIRNACQTALALAEFEAQGGNHKAVIDPDAVIDLQLKHFERVAHAYFDFMRYMKEVYGTDSGQRAKDKFLRADSSSADKGMPLRTRGFESSPLAPEGPFQTGGIFPTGSPSQTGAAFQTGTPFQTGHSFGSFQQYGQARPQSDPNRLSPIGHPQQQPPHHFGGPPQGSSVSSQYGLSNPYSPVERGTSHFVPHDDSQQGQP